MTLPVSKMCCGVVEQDKISPETCPLRPNLYMKYQILRVLGVLLVLLCITVDALISSLHFACILWILKWLYFRHMMFSQSPR